MGKTKSSAKTKYSELNLTKPKKLDWERKFDEIEVYYPNVLIWEPLLLGDEKEKAVKGFIRKTLSSQRQDLIAKVRKWAMNVKLGGAIWREDLLSFLDELEKP